ncbi:neuropeptide S [Pluvialis apricaria]
MDLENMHLTFDETIASSVESTAVQTPRRHRSRVNNTEERLQPVGTSAACLWSGQRCLCRLNFVFILWISTIFVCSGYPVVPSMSSNPFYLNCQLYGKSDYCLVLLNNCLAKVGRNEELAFLKPYLEMPLNKRSFRNGVGSGIKKTSFRRAKS